jgi:hypothetical protein
MLIYLLRCSSWLNIQLLVSSTWMKKKWRRRYIRRRKRVTCRTPFPAKSQPFIFQGAVSGDRKRMENSTGKRVNCSTQKLDKYLYMAISGQKIFLRRRNRLNKWLFPMEFRLCHGTENFWNSVRNHSAEENNPRNSVPLNKNKSKLLKFCSGAFCRRKNISEYRPPNKILFRNISWKKKRSKFYLL